MAAEYTDPKVQDLAEAVDGVAMQLVALRYAVALALRAPGVISRRAVDADNAQAEEPEQAQRHEEHAHALREYLRIMGLHTEHDWDAICGMPHDMAWRIIDAALGGPHTMYVPDDARKVQPYDGMGATA